MGGQLARTIARITESGGSSLPGIGLTFLLPLHAPLRVSDESPQSVESIALSEQSASVLLREPLGYKSGAKLPLLIVIAQADHPITVVNLAGIGKD